MVSLTKERQQKSGRFVWEVEELCIPHIELEVVAKQFMEMSSEHFKMYVWSLREWLRLENKEELFRIWKWVRSPKRRLERGLEASQT